MTTPSVSVSVDEAILTVKMTAPKFFKGLDDETVRHRLLISKLSEAGRISYSQGGSPTNTWKLKVELPTFTPWGSGQEVTFATRDYTEQLTMEWGGYKSSDLFDEHTRVLTNGEAQKIFNYYDEMAADHKESFKNLMHSEFFINGEADGSQKRFWGIETVFGTAGTTVAADKIVKPGSTYAGLSCAFGGLGSSDWTSALSVKPNASIGYDWPDGQGSPRADANSFIWMNSSSTSYDTGSTAFRDNAEHVIRQLIAWQTRLNGKLGGLDLLMLGTDWDVQLRTYLSARYGGLLPHKSSTDMGFKGTYEFDGVPIHTEYDIPASTGYGLNFKSVELAFCTPEMCFTKGPEWSTKDIGYLFLLLAAGNWRFRAKGVSKISAAA